MMKTRWSSADTEVDEQAVRALLAFVDADITLNEVLGPDGNIHDVLAIGAVFTAVRQAGAWFLQDERAHFKPIGSTEQ